MGVTLAEYFAVGDLVVVFVVRQDDFEVVPIDASLSELREFVVEGFSARGGETRVRDLDLGRWQSRLEPFVAPVAERVPEEDVLWLVPYDVLHYVPLHAVAVDGRHLVDRNPVCYTPSGSVMRYCQQNRRGGRRTALVLGDSAEDLGHAHEEGAVVAGLFGTSPRLGRDATKERLLRELEERPDVLHVCCHGYFRADDPLASGIVLATEDEDDPDGLTSLSAAEIFGLELETDLVTLSACESGVIERRSGDELIGLTRALVFAGAPSAVVSLWTVDDLSTSLLMERFYADLAGNGGASVIKAEALRRAQIHVRDLTAEDIVAYSERRLAELEPGGERELQLRRDRANARIAAGDLAVALAEYEELRRDVPAGAAELAAEIAETIELVRFKALAAPEPDYGVRPFEHLYYWAPFVLYGDWL